MDGQDEQDDEMNYPILFILSIHVEFPRRNRQGQALPLQS
jgi:hypothetical protein